MLLLIDEYTMKSKVLTLILLVCAASLAAKVKLPALIGDNMMLQQQTQVKLWGEAAPGAEVKVTPSWSGKTVTCRADGSGRWMLKLKTPAGGYTPYQITFEEGRAEDFSAGQGDFPGKQDNSFAGQDNSFTKKKKLSVKKQHSAKQEQPENETVVVKDILIGEVWLAGGQSNMQMPLKGFAGCCVKNGLDDAIAAADMKGVRMFNVPMRQSYTVQETCEGSWMTTQNFTDVMEFSATAFYFAANLSRALHLPVGIVNCSYGGTRVESWLPRDILQNYPDINTDSVAISRVQPDYERPMLTYNAMFNPIKNYTVKGIIWYQGCSNVGRHATYAQRLSEMVAHWRGEMRLGEIPFYFVEIAPYDYDSGDAVNGARLREAQFRAQSLIPNSAMISTNNLVEPYERYNIHPGNKKGVGHRLSYLALNRTYGMKQVCCFGPQYKSWTVKKNEAWVALDHLEMGVCRNYDIRGFEVAGEDRIFYPADKVWLHWQTNEVVVSSEKVAVPVAVRYCFRDFQPGTLIGGNELPLVPFRTDDW